MGNDSQIPIPAPPLTSTDQSGAKYEGVELIGFQTARSAMPHYKPPPPLAKALKFQEKLDKDAKAKAPQSKRLQTSLLGKETYFIDTYMEEIDRLSNLPALHLENRIKPKPIHNLCEKEIELDLNTHQTLAYGLKFAPTPREIPSDREVLQYFSQFRYNMMNKYSAFVEGWKEKPKNAFGLNLKLKSKVRVSRRLDPRHSVIVNFCQDVREDILMKLDNFRKENPQDDPQGFSNMSSKQAKAVQNLKDGKMGILKPSDKSMGTAISTSKKYKKGCWQHLSDTRTYTQLEEVEKVEFCTKAVNHLTQILAKYNPDSDTKNFLQAFIDNFDIPSFYIIWKIHKLPKEVGRPIVASCHWITTQASIFIAEYLKEYLSHFDTVLQDSNEVLTFVKDNKVPPLCTLFTLDAVSLYTNIPISGERNATEAIRELLKKYPRQNPTAPWEHDFVIDLLDFVLHTNIMEFNKGAFLQIFGIAMGTNLAPILANIYLAILEKEIKEDNKFDPKFKWPLLFKRFIDDILGIMDGTVEDVKYFITIFNKYVASIEVQPIKIGNEVDFLDVVIFKGKEFYKTHMLSTKTFQKEGNAYEYIPFTSNHPSHVHKNLIISELNRYIKNSSEEVYFLQTANLFKQRLRDRGFKKGFISKYFGKVKYSNRESLFKKINQKTPSSNISMQEKVKANPDSILAETRSGEKKGTKRPSPATILKVPFHKDLESLGINKILSFHLNKYCGIHADFNAVFGANPPLVCWEKSKTLGDMLINSKHC
jgi:hypothetical protein